MNGKGLAEKIAQLMLEKKADDVKIFDIRNITTIVDYFVICSASSDTQIKAIANHIKDETAKMGEKPWHNEGLNNLSWVLMDYVNVVAHIFLSSTRKFYNLEGLWADAEIEEVKDEAKIG